MGSVIHGSSHSAIKHFRDNPAAMSVYWVYLARANNEGVAWSSLRGLETDTGWNKDTCAKARKWLVEHGALEAVNKYIRPEWRKLKKTEQRQKVNIDTSEYYRPTGVLTIGNVTYTMLYHGSLDAKAEETEDEPVGVQAGQTPTPSDADAFRRRPDRTELNTISELDSIAELKAAEPGVEVKDKPAKTRKKKDSAPSGATPDSDPASYADWMAFINKEFKVGTGAPSAGYVYGMFKNRAQKGEWKEHNITPPATLDEVKQWVSYEKRKHFEEFKTAEFVYRKAATVNAKFLYWRERRAAVEAEKATNADLERLTA